jgi:rhamnogalacturonyl hydrolase YesR
MPTEWARNKNLVFHGFHSSKRIDRQLRTLMHRWSRSKSWVINQILEDNLPRYAPQNHARSTRSANP